MIHLGTSRMVWIFLLIVTLSLLAIVGYEIYALANDVAGDTISEFFWHVSGKYPIVPFFLGLVIGTLAGHFWWQRPV
jgi:hypothetical protein